MTVLIEPIAARSSTGPRTVGPFQPAGALHIVERNVRRPLADFTSFVVTVTVDDIMIQTAQIVREAKYQSCRKT